ncbi:MAG: PAS domain-containing protein [Treponema sp.]|jgi:signal transduction histidine kinase|nr:PAS domain-containing protein [Treponema sp.]
MSNFYQKALKKNHKLTPEQLTRLLLTASEEIDRLESALDSLNEGVLVCDTQHIMVMANQYAQRFLPFFPRHPGKNPIWFAAADERIGSFLEKTLHEGDRVEDREFELEVRDQMRIFSISIFPLVRKGQVTGSLIHVEDTTEKRSKEAQLRRMENLASLTTLAAGVAHEIKNPLGSLSIHVQLIQKALDSNKEIFYRAHPEGKSEAGPEPARYLEAMDKYIAVINEEIDRLNHIVVDFLFAVRPMDMIFLETDLNALIQDLVGFVRYELEEAGIEPALSLDAKLPLVEFDERFMKQALLNLVKNAIAAMPGGGVLTIKTRQSDTEVFVSIADTGTGISEANRSKIFEPYFTTKSTGTGLGLTLVYKIVREHRGEVSLRSREGEGACFTISLPIPQKATRLIGFEGSLLQGV